MPKVNIDLTKVVAYPVNVIQLLKPVLDDAYARIPGNTAAKDAAISKAIKHLMNEYKDLRVGKDISYAAAEVRFAYIFRYVPAHASLVTEIIRRCSELEELFEEPEVEIVAIGGGPGSEIVGIAKHCAERHLESILTFNLYDRDSAWANTWNRLHKKVQLPVKIFPMFKQLDACEAESWKHEDAFAEADLIAMVFFASEVFKHADEVKPFFRHLFKKAKSGALILYIDNAATTFTEWFDDLAEGWGLECIEGNDGEVIKLSPFEEKSDFEEYFEKFGAPKIQSNVAWRVLRKK